MMRLHIQRMFPMIGTQQFCQPEEGYNPAADQTEAQQRGKEFDQEDRTYQRRELKELSQHPGSRKRNPKQRKQRDKDSNRACYKVACSRRKHRLVVTGHSSSLSDENRQ